MDKKPKSLTQKLKEAKATAHDTRKWLNKVQDEEGRCCSCFYFSADYRAENYILELNTKGSCHRYPNSINVEGSYWCGEYLKRYYAF